MESYQMRTNCVNPSSTATGFCRILTGLIPLLMMLTFNVALAEAGSGPSEGAKGMPGALGTFEFKPSDYSGKDSWWTDTDGVNPGVAGCHVGVDEKGKPNGRTFGEACVEGILVESNPGKDKIHKHTGDVGHPDRFDCKQWCVGTKKGATGSCKAVTGPAPCATSARCECK
jgi:hypothetical protein